MLPHVPGGLCVFLIKKLLDDTSSGSLALTMRCRTLEFMAAVAVDNFNRGMGLKKSIDGSDPILHELLYCFLLNINCFKNLEIYQAQPRHPPLCF